MQNILSFVRYGLRQLRKTPGFAFIVILTLGLGIGANTAIFSVTHALLLRMLPVKDPQQLFHFRHSMAYPENVSNTGDGAFTVGINTYNQLRQEHEYLQDVIAYIPLSSTKVAVRVGNTPEELRGEETSGNFFTALGVRPALGRTFLAEDEEKHSSVAVISYQYWQRRFDKSPEALGQTIFINGAPMTIIGVAAPKFLGVNHTGKATDLWIPLQTRNDLRPWGSTNVDRSLYNSPNWWTIMLMVRLKPGVTAQQAQPKLDSILTHSAYESAGAEGGKPSSLNLELLPVKGLGAEKESYRAPLQILMAMVAVVLAIACINIVMMLIARNTARQKEFSLRTALGAKRHGLLAQLIVESSLLVGAGLVLGWFFALEATRMLGSWAKLETNLEPNGTVLLFTLSISAFVALVCGFAPLSATNSAPLATVLRANSTQTTQSRGSLLRGNAMLVLQMAFCLVLLFSAGLMVRTVRNYQHIDLGMQTDKVLAVRVTPVGVLPAERKIAFYEGLVAQIRALPNVESVTLASNRPGSGWSNNGHVTLDGVGLSGPQGYGEFRNNEIGSDFFDTTGGKILLGRAPNDSDTAISQRVVVVNETFVQRYLQGKQPLGHSIGRRFPAVIIGVARNMKYTEARENEMPMAWFLYRQAQNIANMDVEVRFHGDAAPIMGSIRRIVAGLDPNAPLQSPELLKEAFADSYLIPELLAKLALFFGLLAALLVAIGLYGTMSYRVNRRTTEIGIRMALGATHGQVLWSVLREALRLVAIGVAIGVPTAWATSRWLQSLLYQMSAHDSLSLALAGIGVLAISIAAALLPAWRATSIDPMRSLRAD